MANNIAGISTLTNMRKSLLHVKPDIRHTNDNPPLISTTTSHMANLRNQENKQLHMRICRLGTSHAEVQVDGQMSKKLCSFVTYVRNVEIVFGKLLL